MPEGESAVSFLPGIEIYGKEGFAEQLIQD
jgi:hypothetical protein